MAARKVSTRPSPTQEKSDQQEAKTDEEMAVFKQHDEIIGRLLDINDATSDLAAIMDLLSQQYDAFAKDLSAWLSEMRKGGAQ